MVSIDAQYAYDKLLAEAYDQIQTADRIVIGVGYNTPVLIRFPFWQMTAENQNVRYICINMEQPRLPEQIKGRSMYIQRPCEDVIHRLLELDGKIEA